MILAILLMVVILAACGYAFWGSFAGARVEENVTRTSALLRGARAEAAGKGRRVQLSFDATTRQPIVRIEPDGLGQPGVFTPVAAWWVEQSALQEGVRVSLCELTGTSAFIQASAAAHSGGKSDEAELSAVMFYPDGSSDSVRLVLTSPDTEHPWSVQIALNGVDGTIEVTRLEEQP